MKTKVDRLKSAFHFSAERAKQIARENGHGDKFDKLITKAAARSFADMVEVLKDKVDAAGKIDF